MKPKEAKVWHCANCDVLRRAGESNEAGTILKPLGWREIHVWGNRQPSHQVMICESCLDGIRQNMRADLWDKLFDPSEKEGKP